MPLISWPFNLPNENTNLNHNSRSPESYHRDDLAGSIRLDPLNLNHRSFPGKS